MKIGYTEVVKDQKNNPFCKLRNSDQTLLKSLLLQRLTWLVQLRTSTEDFDQQVYTVLCDTPDKKEWGSALLHNHSANTGSSILAGAVEKLEKGDLSRKQVNWVNKICSVLHRAYPRKWGELELYLETEVDIKVPLSNLFEGLE